MDSDVSHSLSPHVGCASHILPPSVDSGTNVSLTQSTQPSCHFNSPDDSPPSVRC